MLIPTILALLATTITTSEDHPSRGLRFFDAPPKTYCGFSFDLAQQNAEQIIHKLVALKATGKASFEIAYIDFTTWRTVEVVGDCASFGDNQAVKLLQTATNSPGTPIRFQSLSGAEFEQAHFLVAVVPSPPHNPYKGLPDDCVLELSADDFSKSLHKMAGYGVPIIDSIQIRLGDNPARTFIALGMQCEARGNIRTLIRYILPQLPE
jgi:hypothetical protein